MRHDRAEQTARARRKQDVVRGLRAAARPLRVQHQRDPRWGTLLKGRVIKRTPTHVLVDVGFKTEGMIPNEEFTDPEALEALEPGSEIETMLESTDIKDGYLVLSKRRADGLRAIEDLDQAFANGQTVTGRVLERTEGGFNVDVGIMAFLPESHVDIRPVRDAAGLIGQTLK
ncbi:MAG: S1 RNA-binding domain-containing protein, partial [Desulfomicrobium escambiense]|nr:S1 RNA-binding domain-containing protein [Desulfomicrobium escambiense]